MTRTLRFLLLCWSLLLSQQILAGHGIEHACHDHDEACVECLALPGFAAVPTQPPPPFLPAARHIVAIPVVPPAPTLVRPPAFRSRAPPLLHSR